MQLVFGRIPQIAGVVKASPGQRHAWRLVDAELRTKQVNFDKFTGHRFEDITNGERHPGDEEDPVEEETAVEPSSAPHETHPTGGRRVTGKNHDCC